MSATTMLEHNLKRPEGARLPKASHGVAAVEFAMLALVFFTLVFGIIEITRLLYVYNTLQEVTRRAAAGAANVYARNAEGLSEVRHDALFRTNLGHLPLISTVTEASVRIDYLALTRDSTGAMTLAEIPEGALPSCAGQNRQICTSNPNAANCIRFVRARICDPSMSGACSAVRSDLLVPFVSLHVALHKATTIATAESLGYMPGDPPCAAPASAL